MEYGQKVIVEKAKDKNTKRFNGKTGVVVGPFGPSVVVIRFDEDGGEYWINYKSLKVIG